VDGSICIVDFLSGRGCPRSLFNSILSLFGDSSAFGSIPGDTPLEFISMRLRDFRGESHSLGFFLPSPFRFLSFCSGAGLADSSFVLGFFVFNFFPDGMVPPYPWSCFRTRCVAVLLWVT